MRLVRKILSISYRSPLISDQSPEIEKDQFLFGERDQDRSEMEMEMEIKIQIQIQMVIEIEIEIKDWRSEIDLEIDF